MHDSLRENGDVSLYRTSFISCIWDLCHRDHPEFPEVSRYGELERRDYILKRIAAAAIAVVTDSHQLKATISGIYPMDPNRVVVSYFGRPPAPKALSNHSSETIPRILRSLPPDYLYYPAQLWPHKNHTQLFSSLALVNSRRTLPIHLVLTGADYGNLQHLQNQISFLKLNSCVHYLGFLELPLIQYLYQHCFALVMPSYFGPTNLPPIEAANYFKPLILPQSSGYLELFGRYPFYFTQGNIHSLATAIDSAYENPIKSLKRGQQSSDHLTSVYPSSSPILPHISSFFLKAGNWNSSF